MNGNVSGLIGLAMFACGFLLLAVVPNMPPFQYGAMCFLIGSLGLMSYEKFQGKALLKEWSNQPLPIYIWGFAGIGIYNIIIFWASWNAPILEVSILNYLWPFFLVLFSSLYDHKTIKPIALIGITFGCIGCICVFLPEENTDGLFREILPAHILAIAAAILWATYSTLTKKYTYDTSAMAPVLLSAGLLFLFCHLFFEETKMPSAFEWLIIIIMGLFRFSYAFWDYAMRHGDRIMLASASYFTPLLSTTLLIIFGFKPATFGVAIGGGLIVTGCLIVNGDKLIKFIKQKNAAL